MKTNILIKPCRLNECAAVLNLWKESETTPSIADLVEYKDTLAMAFWHALSDMGYERDPRMVRYVKVL